MEDTLPLIYVSGLLIFVIGLGIFVIVQIFKTRRVEGTFNKLQKKLQKENIELVHNMKEDTYSMPEKYPSYRRSFHDGEQYSQNILSTIIIR